MATHNSSGPVSRQQGMLSIFEIIQKKAINDAGGHITKEFQDYGYRLAVEFDDMRHKSLYIKMAKTIDRKILESARTFVLDANATSKGRLFMWKVKELKKTMAEKQSSKKTN